MKIKLAARQFGWMFRLTKILFASALLIASTPPLWAQAQSTDDPWDKPLNLSHSGLATNPAIVIGSDGVEHVVWQNDLGDYVHTRLDGDQWSVPETTNLNNLFGIPLPGVHVPGSQPLIYTGPNPFFIAGPDEYTFAFWISPQGELFSSRGKNQKFEQVTGWDSKRRLAHEAASFAAAVDARGELHVAFLRTVADPKNPAGIYYTHTDINRNWAVPVLLYESPYLRTLVEGEANLSLTTAGTEDTLHVYVAWDNRPRKQVFLAQSADGGQTWKQPLLIAGPAPDAGSAGPFNIQVGATQSSVVLVWQKGQSGGACSQIYQSSKDAGTTWTKPQPMIENLLGCTQTGKFVIDLANISKGPLYFLTETKSEVFLTAWNGLQWSQPQAQPVLSGFEEPEIYTEVVYSCLRASFSGERLYIIGCDQGAGGDVWVTSRDLKSDMSGLKPPVWSLLSPVTSDHLEREAVKLVSTDDGLIHAFFSEHKDPAIYYAYWDGEAWSRIRKVLKLPDGEAGWPAIAAGPGNELFLVAPNNRGALYFSRAASGDAATESRWSTPVQLGIGHEAEIGAVDVAWDAAGTVYVAYSVPVNDERGIYLIQSKDHGTSWSEPLQVFNGAAAGVDLIGAPSLLISSNGLLHVIWIVQSIQGFGIPRPLALYYARSEDGGQTFNQSKPVVEEPVAWREIVADGAGNLHLLWQPQDTLTTVWDQVSLDGGLTWQYPRGLAVAGRLTAVTRDSDGRLHLVCAGPDTLDLWLWNGSSWKSEAPPGWHLSLQPDSSVDLLAATVDKQGEMMLVLAVPTGKGDATEQSLFYSTRTLELSPKQPTAHEVPTKTPLPPTSPPASPTPERLSTATAAVDKVPPNTIQNGTNDRISPFTMALLPVALLLIGVLVMVIRNATRDQDR